MDAIFKSGLVIFNYWDAQQGLIEIRKPFSSLDELFSLCTPADPKLIVDKVVLESEDGRSINLDFLSVAHPLPKKSE